MNPFAQIRASWRCWRAGVHDLQFVRNIHGDEINARNGMRSEWRCVKCGAYRMRPDLYY